MSRELRTTLAIMAVALVISAPLIFAEPSPANTNYLALVMHIVPPPTPTNTPVPSATPTRTPVPSSTPAPTTIPPPTLTPTEITIDIPPVQPPCDQNIPPQIAIGAQAWMTIPAPSRFSQTTVCARFVVSGGFVDRGAVLTATAHYKTTNTDLGSVVAGNDGVAHLSFNIGGATSGYTVTVDGTMGGQPFSTTFTPQ